MPSNLEAAFNDYNRAIKETWEQTKLVMMVFGPDYKTSTLTLGAKLRKYIIEKCTEHGDVFKTEHQEVIRAYRTATGSKHNLCVCEKMAANTVDAIVHIPDSAGSFVELGLFSLVDDICKKSLVLFADKYRPTIMSSFIGLGPYQAYTERAAHVELVNYRATKSTWKIVDEFLKIKRVEKFDKLATRGS